MFRIAKELLEQLIKAIPARDRAKVVVVLFAGVFVVTLAYGGLYVYLRVNHLI